VTTIITKATEYCNANCAYCAVRDKDQKKMKMSISTLRRLLERSRELLESNPQERINITWHGGEPALMGVDFYDAVYALHQEILGPCRERLQYSMQSNITLVDEELIHVIKKLGMRTMGTSYEYYPGLRGIGGSVDSDKYNREFFRALNLLDKHDISPGVIYVVTSRTVHKPVETMILLTNLLSKRFIGHFRINPLYIEGEASKDINQDLYISAEEYGHFLGKAYQFWYERRNFLEGVAPFNGLHKAINGDQNTLSCEERGECGRTHLAVNANGDIYQCGRAMDNVILKYGNLEDTRFSEILKMPQKMELINRSEVLKKKECKDCTLWDYCHGGCPVDSYLSYNDWHRKTYLCEAKQIFLGKYVKPTSMQRQAS